jgi:hypothetical protein
MNTTGRCTLFALLLLGAAAVPAAAGVATEEFAAKAINFPLDSWGIWGPARAETLTDTAIDGGPVHRVVIAPRPEHPWDIGAFVVIRKAVKKGDVVVLAFWAKAEKLPADNDFIAVTGRVYESAPPSASITPETQFLIGRDWKLYYAGGVADKDYAVGTLGCGIKLGGAEQTVLFGPAYVSDLGPDYDLSKLPHN